jgi:hypothetical protein
MASLASIVGNNSIGYIHTVTKVKRAMEKTKTLFSSVIQNPVYSQYKFNNGVVMPVIEGKDLKF